MLRGEILDQDPTPQFCPSNIIDDDDENSINIGEFDAQSCEVPCKSIDEDLWFAENPHLLAQAKAACAQCPLQQMCLDGAILRREPWGVWGGEIFSDGQIVSVKRGRGRPRKAA